ncbi:MAG TPA: FAD-dependent oxidoreductase [Actinomycetota bacterium]|jgi:NADPH-dependent 2,4-dienoyl-CoA reductase/sulfur reductase-like enzyme|nr:FAD-dependent oxidoreductase [Actinomycetota bacterium]
MVVVGGDAAGMSAASQARKRRGPGELEIVAFERGRHTSYSACGLPYYAADVVEDWRDLVARTPEEHAEQDIEVRTRHEVDAIDLEARRVRVRDLDGGRVVEEPWDLLVVATGSTPLRPPIDGIDLPGVYGLSVLEDGIELRKAIDAGPRRAVIVGGGYIGLEAAEALVNRGVPTALVEAAPQVMSRIDPDMGELVSDAVREIGVELHLEEEVEAIEGDGRVRAVRTVRRTLDADLVILGLGTRPAVGLAEASGIELGPSGAIAVNPRMRTRHHGVWAAGDCAEARNLVSGQPVSYHLGTIANKQGRVCGINIGGGYATFPGVLGTAVSKVCDVEVARTGLSEDELADLGLEWEQAAVDSTTRAGYFPGAAPIRTKVLAERRSGRLLGAQIVGKEGAAKRIDVFATALWNGMTVDAMVNMDLSYAPPFSPVWDPVLIATRKLSEQVDRSLGESL